jgi:hypothetical protein
MIADAGFVVEGADEVTLPAHRRGNGVPVAPALRRRGPGTEVPANA